MELALNPFSRVDGSDSLGRDDGCTSTVGVSSWLRTIVRPFDSDAAFRIESLQQMLDERAYGIDPTILRVQPQAVAR